MPSRKWCELIGAYGASKLEGCCTMMHNNLRVKREGGEESEQALYVETKDNGLKLGKEVCSIQQVGGHLYIHEKQSQGNRRILSCCLSPKVLILERSKTSTNKARKVKKNKLMLSTQFFNQILKLGITRGIEQHWERLIYMCIATLNASVPVVDTLPYCPAFRKGFSFTRKHSK